MPLDTPFIQLACYETRILDPVVMVFHIARCQVRARQARAIDKHVEPDLALTSPHYGSWKNFSRTV